MLARLAFRMSKQQPLCHQTTTDSYSIASVRCTKNILVCWPFSTEKMHLNDNTPQQECNFFPSTCPFVACIRTLPTMSLLYRLNFLTECGPCNFPQPPSFPHVLALCQICPCAILITAKAIFMVVFCLWAEPTLGSAVFLMPGHR